jgi:hypothetical protein
MRPAVRALCLGALTAFLYAAVMVQFHRANQYEMAGDEPHYVINGLSIFADSDLKLDNNYANNGLFNVGPLFPHTYQTDQGVYPFRGLGVPLIVGWPALHFGEVGARVALALFIGLLTAVGYRLAAVRLGEPIGTAVAASFFCALPFLVAAGLAFPDMATGALSFVAVGALSLRRDARWSTPARVGFTLATAAIVLIYWRHLPVLALLGVAMMLASLKQHGVNHWRDIDGPRLWRQSSFRADVASFVALILAGLLTLAYIFGNDLQNQGNGFFYVAPVREWIEPFVGHHLDQNHGILWRNPLLWLALPGFVLLWRHERALLLLIGALYVLLFVPQCMTNMLYGAHGIGGRYTWNFVWLWLFPLCAMLKWMIDRGLERTVWIALGLAVLYQLLLATQWLDPRHGDVLKRDNIQAGAQLVYNVFGDWRFVLPEFNFQADSFASPVNVFWLVLAALAFAAVVLAERLNSRTGRRALVVAIVGVGVLVGSIGLARREQPASMKMPVVPMTPPPGAVGYIGYGLAQQVPPGLYRINISLLAPHGGAVWDLRRAQQMGSSERIDTDVIPQTPPTGAHDAIADGVVFNVGADDVINVLGFNVWSENWGPVKLRKVRLTRLGQPTGPTGVVRSTARENQ